MREERGERVRERREEYYKRELVSSRDEFHEKEIYIFF